MDSNEFSGLRRAVLLGLFTGTGIGLGYLLAGVPGVELMSLNAALAGAALGLVTGALAGALSILVYSLSSPFGPPVPLLLAAQVVGMGLCGCMGAMLAPILVRAAAPVKVGAAALSGLLAAVTLDLLTTITASAALSLPLVATLVAGIPVAVLHAVTTSAAFAVLLPVLSLRLRGLLWSGPRSIAPLCIVFMLAGPSISLGQTPAEPWDVPADSHHGDPPAAESDTLAVSEPDSLPSDEVIEETDMPSRRRHPARRTVMDWKRPLWRPFAGSLREELRRRSSWLPVAEGGQGGAVVYYGEPGTVYSPIWERDGLPLSQGHRYLDDPESIITTGHYVETASFGLSGDGSLSGTVGLHSLDQFSDRDILDTRWFKGAHETYLRDVQFLTARAAWRFGFAFGELLDNEAYDFRTPGEIRYQELEEEDPLRRSILWGRSKLRSGRGTVQRDMGSAGTVNLSLENVRKLKLALPAYGLANQDLWHNRAVLDWRTPAGARPGRLALWWLDTDADWNRGRATYRKQEGSSSGLMAVFGDAARGGRLDGAWRRSVLVDSGADTAWAGSDTCKVRLHGEAISLRGSRSWGFGPANLHVTVGGWWNEHGDWLLGGSAGLVDYRPQPRWALALERGGRAPRSDELATAWRFVVPLGRQTIALPNRALGREDEWRLAAESSTRLAGFDLALSAALRRLRDGIAWQPLEPASATGRWQNGLKLDSTTMRASIAREGRCLGWIRMRADLTWRSWRQEGDFHLALPPALDWRLSALWEQHFFREDGILQLAWFLRHRSDMDDPWFLAEPFELPTATSLDMIVAFRLVGADLGLELLNLAGGGSRLSAGTVDHGLELRWRLHWVFHY